MLGVVITTALFHNHPDLPEGQLAKLRASVVNMRALADVARGLGPHGLGPHLLLGKGEETTGGRDKASILADTLEALLGAIYLEHGLDIAGEVIHRLFDPLMAESAGRGAGAGLEDQPAGADRGARAGRAGVRIEDAGPDHAKTFTAWVVVAGERYGGSEGRSKKEAEQRAAEAAWRTLQRPRTPTAEARRRRRRRAGEPTAVDRADDASRRPRTTKASGVRPAGWRGRRHRARASSR